MAPIDAAMRRSVNLCVMLCKQCSAERLVDKSDVTEQDAQYTALSKYVQVGIVAHQHHLS
jgi:hypothetical protein